MIPSITFTMTDRTIKRYPTDGSYWRKGEVQFEKRVYLKRTVVHDDFIDVAKTEPITVYKHKYLGAKTWHYNIAQSIAGPFPHGHFAHGLDWDAALQLIKERIIAQLVCKRLQETA